MRLNTTVVETDVYHLTDSILLGDGVRVERCARTGYVGPTAGSAGTGT
jgi:hypothetical protein